MGVPKVTHLNIPDSNMCRSSSTKISLDLKDVLTPNSISPMTIEYPNTLRNISKYAENIASASMPIYSPRDIQVQIPGTARPKYRMKSGRIRNSLKMQ